MTLSLSAHWPSLAQGIARILGAMFVQIGRQPIEAHRAVDKSDAAEYQPRFDASRLDRVGLLVELLAPTPDFALAEQHLRSSRPLPMAVDSAITRKLSAARELIQRDLLAEMQARPVFDKPGQLGEWLQLHCAGLDYEVFLVMYLDAQNHLITIEQPFRGTLTKTSVYPREVLKAVLDHRAASVVLAHNHPSGDLTPSRADQCITQTLKSTLGLIDVHVLDHFIVANGKHYSFAEHGLI